MGLLEGYGLQKAALARGLIPANSIILNDVFGTRECDTMAQYGADRLEVARTPVWLAWSNAHALAQAVASMTCSRSISGNSKEPLAARYDSPR
jgi:hypothetical protein